jgi:hypothetical protein
VISYPGSTIVRRKSHGIEASTQPNAIEEEKKKKKKKKKEAELRDRKRSKGKNWTGLHDNDNKKRKHRDIISQRSRRKKGHIPATMACNPSTVTPCIELDVLRTVNYHNQRARR